MKKAYFVFGGESCGNHLVTNLLVHAGIQKGTGSRDLKNLIDLREPDFPRVFRRSFPFAGTWPEISEMMHQMEKFVKWKEVFVIVPVRNWAAAVGSSLIRNHSQSKEDAIRKLQKAYKNIFLQLINRGVDYMIFSYDEIIVNPEGYLRKFYDSLELPMSDEKIKEIASTITEENKKFYSTKKIELNRPSEGY